MVYKFYEASPLSHKRNRRWSIYLC